MNTLLGGSPFNASYAQANAAVKQDYQLPRPLERISYPDFATVWLREKPPQDELDWVKTQCGSKGPNGARRKPFDVRQEPAKWDRDRAYQVRLQMRQPSHLVLQWLATLDDAVLNYLEIALDWIFASARERDEAHALVNKHHWKKWHGNQEITFDQQTRYTARRLTASERRVANLLTSYPDRACRITAEECCEHGEWRLVGLRALQRAGLTVGGLKDLDHQAFWQARLLLRTVDVETLGRLYRVHVQGDRVRGRLGDSELGHRLLCAVGSEAKGTKGTVQAVVDKYRKRFDVGRCLRVLEVDEFLLPNVSGWDDDIRR
jgi:hypothetical protein